MITQHTKYVKLAEAKAEAKAAGSSDEHVDERAAKVIQHMVKRYRLTFGDLGHNIFSRKGGDPADHGHIYFPDANHKAPFITVSDTTTAALLSNFMEKHWRLARPDIVISVTGGAQDFVLSSQLQRVFDRGLVSAASSTNAWVITGGTDTGVMKLVATAFRENNVQVPLIGVTSFGCVNGREALEQARKDTRTYTCGHSKPTAKGAPLNCHHTHFVFVDSGKAAPEAWGGEIALRSNLEVAYARLKSVPLVLLVVQGGPGTLNTVLSAVRLRQAVLVVRDSGGAADAIADYLRDGSTCDAKFQSEALQTTLGHIKALHDAAGDHGITVFSMHEEAEMSTMLLKAMMKTLPPPRRGDAELASGTESRARALMLAVTWDRVDMANELLLAMSTERKFTLAHHRALMSVLQRQVITAVITTSTGCHTGS